MTQDSSKARNPDSQDGITRREFMGAAVGTVATVSLGPLLSACGGTGGESAVASYPIEASVATTLQRTVRLGQRFTGRLAAAELQKVEDYDGYGYGAWTYGGPLAAVRRTELMAAGYVPPATPRPVTLARFFAMTDIHVTDKESPSQLIYMQPANLLGNLLHRDIESAATSVYSPTMLYTTHVLDAAIQTVNALHRQAPIDFGLSLGDTCNSTQYNELRWYIDVIDGKVVTPSSGAHAGGDTIDYQKPYQAAGLDPAIPWYQAIGNHDHFWLGAVPPDAGNLRPTCTSDEVLAKDDALWNASNIYNTRPPILPLYYMGVIDGTTPTGKIIKAGKVGDPGFTTPPKVVPDQDRRSLTMAEWKREFFHTSTSPAGHGFHLVPPGHEEGFACYSFVPKPAVPLKVIVLDDTQREDDGATSVHGRGFLDPDRWAWLKAELAAGDAAGQLMIIAAHVPIGVCPHARDNGGSDTFMDWFDNAGNPTSMQNAVTLPALLAELHSHPNLLMWVAGHRHVNAVKAFPTDDPARPERGFWQVETSSLHDFPQQFRLFEIGLASDYAVSISATNVDTAAKAGTPAWTSRKYAVAAQQIVRTNLRPSFANADPSLPAGTDPSLEATYAGMDPDVCAYNAELLVALSPAMKAKLQGLFPVAPS